MIDPQPTAPPIPFLYVLHGWAFWLFVIALVLAVAATVVLIATRGRGNELARPLSRVALWAGIVTVMAGAFVIILPAGTPPA